MSRMNITHSGGTEALDSIGKAVVADGNIMLPQVGLGAWMQMENETWTNCCGCTIQRGYRVALGALLSRKVGYRQNQSQEPR